MLITVPIVVMRSIVMHSSNCVVHIILQVVILVALSFTYKRARLCRRCLKGYPGIVVYVVKWMFLLFWGLL